MPIWKYGDISRDLDLLWSTDDCPFCNLTLHKIFSRSKQGHTKQVEEVIDISICRTCGWPMAKKIITGIDHFGRMGIATRVFGSIGSLKELDLNDITIPMNEVRTYLTAKYSERYKVNPRKFEEVVADVFKDHGYKVKVTNYSGDDGIDAFLYDQKGEIGVQVKRYKNSIAVEQIRSLAGAMVLRGITRGVFVTTSAFQSGAKKTVERFRREGLSIQLYDSARFFDSLKIAQIRKFDLNDHYDLLINNLKLISESFDLSSNDF